MALNEKQKRFADEYLIDLNGAQAAIRAGYAEGSAKVQAARLLTDDNLQAYITEKRASLIEKTELTQEWVLNRLKAISDRCMTAEPVMKFDYDEKKLVQETEIDPETGEEVGVFTFDSNGANKATELIGKHLGMFITKKVEHSGEIGNPQLNFFPASQKPKDE